MSKFKAGDKVKVYGSSQTGMHRADGGCVGTVFNECEPLSAGWYNIRFKSGDTTYTYHEKQMRKLKPAKPRRIISMSADGVAHMDRGYAFTAILNPGPPAEGSIVFKEVRKKKGQK